MNQIMGFKKKFIYFFVFLTRDLCKEWCSQCKNLDCNDTRQMFLHNYNLFLSKAVRCSIPNNEFTILFLDIVRDSTCVCCQEFWNVLWINEDSSGTCRMMEIVFNAEIYFNSYYAELSNTTPQITSSLVSTYRSHTLGYHGASNVCQSFISAEVHVR